MKWIAVWLIRFYRKFISPLKPPVCRFVPTCSMYALQVYEEWGFFRGTALVLWRILRCNPFCRGGFDPAPRRVVKPVRHLRGEFDPYWNDATAGQTPGPGAGNQTISNQQTEKHTVSD